MKDSYNSVDKKTSNTIKNGHGSEKTFSEDMNDQKIHEKMLNVTKYCVNVN